jgi:nicotinamidase/pyrazinamidase
MPTYDPTTALLVVDVQNDFADPAGSLFVQEGDRVVPIANAQIRLARQARALVVATQDWHPPHTPHFAQDGGIWPVHCVQDTWGANLHPALEGTDEVVRKGADGKDGYSGFSVRDPETGEVDATPLEQLLRDARIERLVVCGLATDYCVVETVGDARMLGYPVEVLGAGIRAVDREPGDGERAIARMRNAGAEVVS